MRGISSAASPIRQTSRAAHLTAAGNWPLAIGDPRLTARKNGTNLLQLQYLRIIETRADRPTLSLAAPQPDKPPSPIFNFARGAVAVAVVLQTGLNSSPSPHLTSPARLNVNTLARCGPHKDRETDIGTYILLTYIHIHPSLFGLHYSLRNRQSAPACLLLACLLTCLFATAFAQLDKRHLRYRNPVCLLACLLACCSPTCTHSSSPGPTKRFVNVYTSGPPIPLPHLHPPSLKGPTSPPLSPPPPFTPPTQLTHPKLVEPLSKGPSYFIFRAVPRSLKGFQFKVWKPST